MARAAPWPDCQFWLKLLLINNRLTSGTASKDHKLLSEKYRFSSQHFRPHPSSPLNLNSAFEDLRICHNLRIRWLLVPLVDSFFIQYLLHHFDLTSNSTQYHRWRSLGLRCLQFRAEIALLGFATCNWSVIDNLPYSPESQLKSLGFHACLDLFRAFKSTKG